MTTTLEEQAEAFANNLAATTRAVVGDECPAFFSRALQHGDAFHIRQEPQSGIVLCDEECAILRLSVDYNCVYDGHKQYMAIEQSKIHVFVEPGGREPLFRYEYVRSLSANLPSAHIQFHGIHPELEQAMKDCGDSTGRAKARRRGLKEARLTALHFPVGGPRFRPALEDVLEMLIEEFGVKPVTSVKAARAALADAREVWRRTQVSTVVRDAPADAAATLQELGYEVTPPEQALADKVEKLRAF